jgi:electron transport complex protein RnfG
MVGYDLEADRLTGLQIISHSETPGIGSRVTEDTFTKQFKGMSIGLNFSTKDDGGGVDAVSGATYSSRGVCEALRESVKLYPDMKKRVVE